MNYRLGWVLILGMSGALACGDSLQELIEDLDLPLDHLPEPPTIEPPWTDPTDPPVAPGTSDAGADAAATPGPDEPPVVLEPCDPEDPDPPPAAVDAGPPPIEPPPIEPPPIEPPPDPQPVDAGAPPPVPAVDAGAPVEPPPVEEPPVKEPPVKKPPVKKPPIEPPPAPVTSFEADVWPIFVSSCLPCHTTSRFGGHSVGSADLAVAFADATRLGPTLIARLDGGGMPLGCTGNPGDPGCISVEALATVQAWLDDGLAP